MAVDPQSRNAILEGIERLNREGATIVYTSHYMEEVEQLCSRIMIMDKGKAIATGTKEELKAMIRTGETITVEIYALGPDTLETVPGPARRHRRRLCGRPADRPVPKRRP